jgi:hypothetical protein
VDEAVCYHVLAIQSLLHWEQPIASTKVEPPKIEQIPFGPHLTCSQCGGRCTDHYSVSNNIWCPECAAGRIHPRGEHPTLGAKEPAWFPTEEDKWLKGLRDRRARLLERIQEAATDRYYGGCVALSESLQDLKDELQAVESALGWPEAEEPVEANPPSFCPTCLCLLNHEDPAQSCQCSR